MLNSDFRDILSAFCEEQVEFMVVGAYAVAAHGLPRATGDIDLWIKSSPENVERVWTALLQFGAPLQNLSKQDLLARETVLQIGVIPRRIDILTQISGVEYSEAESEREFISIEGLTVPVIGLAHLLQNKTAVARPQDNADVARLREIQLQQAKEE